MQQSLFVPQLPHPASKRQQQVPHLQDAPPHKTETISHPNGTPSRDGRQQQTPTLQPLSRPPTPTIPPSPRHPPGGPPAGGPPGGQPPPKSYSMSSTCSSFSISSSHVLPFSLSLPLLDCTITLLLDLL